MLFCRVLKYVTHVSTTWVNGPMRTQWNTTGLSADGLAKETIEVWRREPMNSLSDRMWSTFLLWDAVVFRVSFSHFRIKCWYCYFECFISLNTLQPNDSQITMFPLIVWCTRSKHDSSSYFFYFFFNTHNCACYRWEIYMSMYFFYVCT